jgi:hypothetical protein
MGAMPPIGSAIDQYAVDDIVDAYVDWREQSRHVWIAYARWASAPADDAQLRFAAYLAELDQEQRACDVYAATVSRTAAIHASRTRRA